MANINDGDKVFLNKSGIIVEQETGTPGSYETLLNLDHTNIRAEDAIEEGLVQTEHGVPTGDVYAGNRGTSRLEIVGFITAASFTGTDSLRERLYPANTNGKKTMKNYRVTIPDYDGAATGVYAELDSCFVENGFNFSSADQTAGSNGDTSELTIVCTGTINWVDY